MQFLPGTLFGPAGMFALFGRGGLPPGVVRGADHFHTSLGPATMHVKGFALVGNRIVREVATEREQNGVPFPLHAIQERVNELAPVEV